MSLANAITSTISGRYQDAAHNKREGWSKLRAILTSGNTRNADEAVTIADHIGVSPMRVAAIADAYELAAALRNGPSVADAEAAFAAADGDYKDALIRSDRERHNCCHDIQCRLEERRQDLLMVEAGHSDSKRIKKRIDEIDAEVKALQARKSLADNIIDEPRKRRLQAKATRDSRLAELKQLAEIEQGHPYLFNASIMPAWL